MTYSHLRADCLYTRISPGTTLGNEYGKPLPLPPIYFSFSELHCALCQLYDIRHVEVPRVADPKGAFVETFCKLSCNWVTVKIDRFNKVC